MDAETIDLGVVKPDCNPCTPCKTDTAATPAKPTYPELCLKETQFDALKNACGGSLSIDQEITVTARVRVKALKGDGNNDWDKRSVDLCVLNFSDVQTDGDVEEEAEGETVTHVDRLKKNVKKKAEAESTTQESPAAQMKGKLKSY